MKRIAKFEKVSLEQFKSGLADCVDLEKHPNVNADEVYS